MRQTLIASELEARCLSFNLKKRPASMLTPDSFQGRRSSRPLWPSTPKRTTVPLKARSQSSKTIIAGPATTNCPMPLRSNRPSERRRSSICGRATTERFRPRAWPPNSYRSSTSSDRTTTNPRFGRRATWRSTTRGSSNSKTSTPTNSRISERTPIDMYLIVLRKSRYRIRGRTRPRSWRLRL